MFIDQVSETLYWFQYNLPEPSRAFMDEYWNILKMEQQFIITIGYYAYNEVQPEATKFFSERQ